MSWLQRAWKKVNRWVRGKRGVLLDLLDSSIPSVRIEFTIWLAAALDKVLPGDFPTEAQIEAWINEASAPFVDRALDYLKGLRAKLP
jgi:hypothetical protein